MKKKMTIERYHHGRMKREEDDVIMECELTLEAREQRFHLMCSPDHQKELAIGFLYNGGLITALADIEEIFEKDHSFTFKLKGEVAGSYRPVRTSGCLGMGIANEGAITGNEEEMQITAGEVQELSERLNRYSGLFRETGGVHASLALLDDGSELYDEDIGRHNTFDKLVGGAVMRGKSLERSMIMTTGRISSEMVMKAARNKVGIIISRSAPTDLAVELAQQYGIVLIGFARGSRFNRYTLIE